MHTLFRPAMFIGTKFHPSQLSIPSRKRHLSPHPGRPQIKSNWKGVTPERLAITWPWILGLRGEIYPIHKL